jgi:hypothetical protein
VPRDSGRVHGNLHQPRRYHRGLLRACCLAAMLSLRTCAALLPMQTHEGKSQVQAVSRERQHVAGTNRKASVSNRAVLTLTTASGCRSFLQLPLAPSRALPALDFFRENQRDDHYL